MTNPLTNELDTLQECFDEFKGEGQLDIIYQDATRLIKALRKAIEQRDGILSVAAWSGADYDIRLEQLQKEIQQILCDTSDSEVCGEGDL